MLTNKKKKSITIKSTKSKKKAVKEPKLVNECLPDSDIESQMDDYMIKDPSDASNSSSNCDKKECKNTDKDKSYNSLTLNMLK